MDRSKNIGFADRLSATADAKKAQLERATRARSAAESPAAVERRTAPEVVRVARDARMAERKATKLAVEARQAAALAAAKAAETAAREVIADVILNFGHAETSFPTDDQAVDLLGSPPPMRGRIGVRATRRMVSATRALAPWVLTLFSTSKLPPHRQWKIEGRPGLLGLGEPQRMFVCGFRGKSPG
jgi:hypothetical protein